MSFEYGSLCLQSCAEDDEEEEEEEEGEGKTFEVRSQASLEFFSNHVRYIKNVLFSNYFVCVGFQEKEMEKQKILYQQARLHARGAAEMVLQMISASKGSLYLIMCSSWPRSQFTLLSPIILVSRAVLSIFRAV